MSSLDAAYEFLASIELLSLATASKDGVPHCAPSFFAIDGRNILFTTSDQSISGQNLLENPLAAFGEGDSPDPGQTWDDAKGIQIIGDVEALEGDAAEDAATKLIAAYAHLGDSVRQSHMFRLVPSKVKYLHKGESDQFQSLGVSWVVEEF